MKKNIILDERTYFFFVISCMIIMPFAELVSEIFGIVYYSQPAILSVYGIAGFCLCTLRIMMNIKSNGIKWQDIFFISLFTFTVIALVFSSAGLDGGEQLSNSELPAHFLAYYSLMYASFQINDKRRRKIIIFAFAGLAFAEGILGILQTFEIKIQDVFWEETTTQVYGLTQNTNYFGGLSVLFFGATIALFIFSEKKLHKLITAIIFAITYYCSFNTMARLAWVGDFAIVLFMIISILIMKGRNKGDGLYRKYIVSWAVSLLLISVITVASFMKSDLPAERVSQSVSELESGDVNEFGTLRGYIWKYCFESVPKHWATGIGLDNLRMVFYENPSWKEGMYSRGKAHNEYIHTLTTQGVFAIFNYLLLLILSAKKSIRKILDTKDKEERILTWITLAMFSGYVVQALFNSSIINVAMYFWIVVGLLNPRDNTAPQLIDING